MKRVLGAVRWCNECAWDAVTDGLRPTATLLGYLCQSASLIENLLAKDRQCSPEQRVWLEGMLHRMEMRSELVERHLAEAAETRRWVRSQILGSVNPQHDD